MATPKNPPIEIEVVHASAKELRLQRGLQKANERHARYRHRQERNAKLEAQQAKRQEREPQRQPDPGYEATRQERKQAEMADLKARADALFANYNEGDDS